MINPGEVLGFWLDEVGPDGWYAQDDALDAQVRDRFEAAWEQAKAGSFSLWLTYPSGVLAYIILTDQFPRNMFRGEARAFSTDRPSLAAAKSAIDRNWDLKIDEPARQFFYLPLMHSENLCDQDRCVRLMHERLPQTGASNLIHGSESSPTLDRATDSGRKFAEFDFLWTATRRPGQSARRAPGTVAAKSRSTRSSRAVISVCGGGGGASGKSSA